MNNSNLSNLVKGVLAASLIVVLAACGSKKNDNNNTDTNVFTQSCVNCDGITGFPFFTSQTMAYSQSYYGYSSTNAMTLNWSFSGQNINGQAQGQSSTPTYNQYASPAMNYSGKVSAAGKIKVAAALNFGFCPQIPAGEYNLSTQTVGQWTNGQISGLKLIISGAVTMTAVLSQAQASESTYQYSTSNRVNGNLIIEQVNGYYCQGAQLYMN